MKACRVALKFRRYRESLESSIPDLIKKILPQHRLEQIVKACGIKFRKRHFTPMATVWFMKLNANRKKPDFRKCHKRLGKGDGLFVWKRPARKDWERDWALESDYDEPPETLIVRIIRYTIRIPGFRAKPVTLVTTLLDSEQYPAAELAKLYGRRWSVEVDLRDMKTTMGMEFINAKTSEMIRKEIWMYTLAYNVIRQVMQDAAVAYDLPMERVSFKGSQQLLLAMTAAIGTASGRTMTDAYELMLFGISLGISQRPVRIRRNRSEPRVLKRRKGKHAYMTRLRNAYDRRPKASPAELLVA